MRLLVISDTQIGVSTVSLDSQASVLAQAVERAVEEKVDAFLHCGDVFEGPVVLPEHWRLFIDRTAPLREAGIPTILLRGNGRHDMAVRPQHALDVLREIRGIAIADRPSVYEIGDGHICALPWVHSGLLLSMLNGSTTHDAANENLAKMLITIARDLHRNVSRFNGSVALAAHWAITGSRLPSGIGVEEMREPVLDWGDLAAIGYDTIIAGHIHEPQRLDDGRLDKTLGIVPGSPQQLNHGEHGEHGCWLVDTTHMLADFIPLEAPKFITIERGFEADPRVLDVLDFSNTIVKVRFQGTEEEWRRIDTHALTQQFLEAGASLVSYEPRITRTDRARADQLFTKQMPPDHFFRAYCDAEAITGATVERARRLLQEWSQ